MANKNNFRLLVVTPALPPDIGGPATYSQLLLDKLPPKGFEVQVESYGWTAGYPKILRYLLFSFRILKKSFWADGIYAMDPVFGLAGLCAARLTGKKFFLKIVGDYAWEQGTNRFGVTDLLDVFVATDSKKYRRPVRFLRRVQTFVARQADAIVTPSEYLKNIVSAWGVDRGKITVVYNAFGLEYAPKNKQELRRNLNMEGFVVMSAGRLVPWKGFESLIKVAGRLHKRYPALALLIAGDGPERRRLEEVVRDQKAGDFVRLLGRVEQGSLLAYCQAADVFVLNTGYEGLSHQLLEVMAVGTPIITTNVGGNPELIADGSTGRLIGYNDEEALQAALSEMIHTPSRAQILAANAQEKVKEFNEERLLSETAAILKGKS
ncbi:MAG TPA: glycosyltransferase family 4 protein [Candidatus Paceibacterota bacterium]|nr:glycosyltransferase family 4 protein [Candidatus Paceibacterota bacterium]